MGSLGRVHDDDSLHWTLVHNRKNFAQLSCRGNEQNTHAGISENVCDLFRSQRGVDRHRHRAQQQASEVRDRPFRTVFAQNRNPVAVSDPPSSQRPGNAAHSLLQLLRRNGKPLLAMPVAHDVGASATDNLKENVVEGL